MKSTVPYWGAACAAAAAARRDRCGPDCAQRGLRAVLSLTSTAQKCHEACEIEESGGGVVRSDAGRDEAPGGCGRHQNRPPAARWRALTRVPDCCTRGAARRARVPRPRARCAHPHRRILRRSLRRDDRGRRPGRRRRNLWRGGRRSRRDEGGSRGRRADEADARRGRGPVFAAPEGLATGAAPGTAAVQEDFGEAGPCCHQICKEGAARDGAAREDALDAACPCPDAASTVEVPSVPATTQSTRCCPCDCVSTRLTGLCPHRRRRKRPRRPRRV